MHTYIIIFLLESHKILYPCCVLQETLQPQNKAFNLKKRPRAATKLPRRLLGPGLSFSTSKVTHVCPKQVAIPYTTGIICRERAYKTFEDKFRKHVDLFWQPNKCTHRHRQTCISKKEEKQQSNKVVYPRKMKTQI